MIDLIIYDKAFLPSNTFILALNRSLKFLWYRKPQGNTKRAKVLKWIAKYSPIPLVYDSSEVNNRRRAYSGKKFYFKEKEIAN